MIRKVTNVTGFRADYGFLRWIIVGPFKDPKLELILLVTGIHLSSNLGLTCKEIEQDNFD